MLKDLGLSAWAVASAPAVKTHDLDVPRIGYVHSWTRTQDEGWWRAALDTYGVPYTYFADQKLRDGNLRAKYDVIIFPHVGGSAAVAGERHADDRQRRRCRTRRRTSTPNLGVRRFERRHPRRHGAAEGSSSWRSSSQQGGTLITEGSTTTIFPEYGITAGVTVEHPAQLFVRGSILRGKIADRRARSRTATRAPTCPCTSTRIRC